MTQAYAHVLTSAIHTFQTYIYIYINAYVYTYIFILAYSMFIRTCCIVQTLSFHPPPQTTTLRLVLLPHCTASNILRHPQKILFLCFLIVSLFLSSYRSRGSSRTRDPVLFRGILVHYSPFLFGTNLNKLNRINQNPVRLRMSHK